jgi:hypothetical protein
LPAIEPQSFVHVHRHNGQVDLNTNSNKIVKVSVLSTLADRRSGDAEGKPVYTRTEDGKISERYVPSDTKDNRVKHSDWRIDRWDGKKWVPYLSSKSPQASNIEPNSNTGSDSWLVAGQVLGGSRRESFNGGAP